MDSWIVPAWSLTKEEVFRIGLLDRLRLLFQIGLAYSLKNEEVFQIRPKCFYHGPDVSRAIVMQPPCWTVTHSYLTEQTRTNMFQPGRRPGTAVGDEPGDEPGDEQGGHMTMARLTSGPW